MGVSVEASLSHLGHCAAPWTATKRNVRDRMDGLDAKIVGAKGAGGSVVPRTKRAADFSAARRHSINCLSL
jgi:hypothetical protein